MAALGCAPQEGAAGSGDRNAVENAILDRTDRVLETWAAADPGTPDEGLTVKQEIKEIHEAMTAETKNF